MGTVIYSASLLQAFAGLLGTVLFMAGIGIVGLVAAIFRRNQGKGARIAMGVAGVFLLIVSCITAAFTYVSNVSGAQTVTVRLNDKHIRQESCGNGDTVDTCTRYMLETNAGQVYYDFVVNAQAYELAEVNTCYQATFYKSKSPLNVTADLDTYHRVEAITRIEVADPAACQ